jgi:hypothetical protein
MKIKIKRNRGLLSALLMGFIFSSFTIRKTDIPENIGGTSESDKVVVYTNQIVCTPIRRSFEKEFNQKIFSRCWSGYAPQFTSAQPLKTDDFVYGAIIYTAGCSSPEYICYFKICVDKGYAAVRSKGSDEYVSIDEWLKIKQWGNSEHKNVFRSKNNG